jgi:hypothetical protein
MDEPFSISKIRMYCVAALPVQVVLLDAGLHTVPVALALGDVEGVAVDHPGPGRRAVDRDVRPPRSREALQPLDGGRPVLVGHEAEVALEVLLPLQELGFPLLRRSEARGEQALTAWVPTAAAPIRAARAPRRLMGLSRIEWPPSSFPSPPLK